MRRGFRVFVATAGLTLVPASLSLAARPAITGTLDKSGYTVIALTANGVAKSVVTRGGRFAVRPPGARVTLHLRARNGTYAGPVVIARAGARAILGVRAGAHLGTIAIRRGYARVTRKVARRWVDRARWGRARKGVPIGAGNFGRVRSEPPRSAPPGDRDADGIAGPVDIDDDGDLVLDDVERRPGTARAAQTQQGPSLGNFTLLYELGNATFPPAGPMTQPVNVNAGVGDEAIDTALRAEGKLSIAESGKTYSSGELDCRGLSYCSAGGTGLHEPPGGNSVTPAPGVAPFPACCDPDGNGNGAFDILGGALNLFLHPRASSDQIRGGDVLIAHGTCTSPCAPDGSTQLELAGTLGTVFATVPAIASYITEDNVLHEPSYPLKPTGSDFPKAESIGEEITVFDGPDADTDASVTLNFWRPQRRAIPQEVTGGTGTWIDIGHLIQFAHTLGASSTTWCPADSYSDVKGGLSPIELVIPGSPELPRNTASVFVDSDDDQPAARDHVFSYRLDVTRCLAARGHEFGPGARVALVFDAMLPLVPGQPINFAESGYAFHNAPPG